MSYISFNDSLSKKKENILAGQTKASANGKRKKSLKSCQVNIRLEPELLKRLDDYRADEDASQGWVCRKALLEFLNRAGK